ncbi:hypothetical protein SPRG_13001 [Saprolegnia parasitica CBS 223.65]|uniref:F-box domain-containing protein n=1 Tax=Saprolegnia parasitica (strain CBS 223.65) TaxID=695850 RepID=A0A067BTS8_SAPPC|nr:hypothetical protein SPRG_13001 [Saprolegnia parasitica CBS 223.65]KDO21663.1 hypothetical protein SPRG_13001 [Saprolegnia parasitica CBS 223.65]|eukprot:XP_012207587.1 hypothetical protein SPRG_13001 [Saprolegnia parasitica CBS 223.65]
MTGRKQKAARVTLPDALALPHVVEAIATCLRDQKDFSSFLYAVPHSLWTPALTAILDCATAMPSTVSTNWPRIELRSMELPPSILTLLAATLPLRPRIELRCPIRQAAPLASLVAVVGPALSSVFLCFHRGHMVGGGGQVISDLLLQRSWLSTAPATKLRLANVAQMDHDGAIAFCDALQAKSTLQELAISHVPSLGGFHGRTLPVSLKTLEWNSNYSGHVDPATMTDLATAVGATQLERLECSVFGQLATCPAAAPMLLQLQSLTVSGLQANHMKALIDGLSSVPALTSLELCNCFLLLSTELLMKTLATTCVHLETLQLWDCDDLTQREAAVLSGTLDLPRLTSLTMAIRLSPMLDVLPELVAAGRQLRTLHLETSDDGEEHGDADEDKLALCRALALIQSVPFVVEALPEDTDAFVVDALGPRADSGDRCRLLFT